MKKCIFLLLLLVVTSCFGGKLLRSHGNLSKIGKKQTSLSNTKWEVTGDLKTNTRPYIYFDQEGKISGNAGCNKIFSDNVSVSPRNGSFSVKNIASTRMLCPNMNMKIEENLIGVLQSADKYVVSDSFLEFYKEKLLLIRLKRLY